MLYIFDMGGVVTTTAQIDDELCSMLGITTEEYYNFCGHEKNGIKSEYTTDLMDLYSNGIINTKEFYHAFSARSEIEIKYDYFHNLYSPVLFKKTVQIINKLKEQGNRVVCGTNTWETYYNIHLERGDYRYFDKVYASNYLGVSKPNPDFWKLILQFEKALPENTVFIDDRQKNIDAALKLGIKSILFESPEQLAKELKITV